MRKTIHIALILVNLTVALFTLVASYGGMVDPHTTAIPALLTLSLPFWIIGTLLMIIIDLLVPLNRRLALIPGVSLLLCAGPVLSFSPLHFPSSEELSPADSAKCFTFMTFNAQNLHDFSNPDFSDTIPYNERWRITHRETRCNPTISYILEKNPDVGFIQEYSGTAPFFPYFFTQSQVDSMVQAWPYRADSHLQGILSRFPLREIKLRQPGKSDGNGFIAAEMRIFSDTVLLVSVHLKSIGLSNDDKELYESLTDGKPDQGLKAVKRQLISKLSAAFRSRADEARLLGSQIDSLGYRNVIIAGDFNDVPSCYAIRHFEQMGFRSAYDMAANGPTNTYHASRMYFRIDHILYRGDLQPLSVTRGNRKLSDHYPLFATFLVSKE